MKATILGVLAACSHPPSTPPKLVPPPIDAAAAPAIDALTKIGVALTVTPPDAEVLIDGVSYGKASELGAVIELKPGLYTLQVAREGYRSYRVEFSVGEKTESFVVRLEQVK
jgi:PEGA domain